MATETTPTTPTTQPAAPAATTQTPPAAPAAPAEKTPSEKMAAIVGNLAGKEPPKTEPAAPPATPAKPAEPEPPKTEPAAKKSNFQEGRKRIETKASKLEARLSEAQAKIAELETKAKTGELTEVEQLRAEQLTAQREQMYEEIEHEYHIAAAEALGDDYDAFAENNKYYASLLNKDAPDFAIAISKMRDHFMPLAVLYNGFTEGTVNYETFLKLPYPRQMLFFRKIIERIENAASGQPPAAPASPAAPPATPPVVPNPQDLPTGTPKDKNAKMMQIVRNIAKNYG